MIVFDGILLLIGLTLLSGFLGGWIYFKDESGIKLRSGAIGHALAGVGGAVVTIAAAEAAFGLGVDVFEAGSNTEKSVIKTGLYVLGLGVLGGYSTLRMIPGLSELALKKLQEQVNQNQNQNIEQNIEQEFELALLRGTMVIQSDGKPEDALRHADSALKIHPENTDALIVKGGAFKRLGRHEEALQCAQQARHIEAHWIHSFNAACYMNLLRDFEKGAGREERYKESEVISLIEEARKLVPLSAKQPFLKSLNEDTDLKSFRDNNKLLIESLKQEIS